MGPLDIVKWLDTKPSKTKNGIYIINIIIGLLSSIVGNVPLVGMGMSVQKQDFIRRIVLGVFGYY